ncbi:endonuclease/exonuclease/phosphatase family protein [Winogradskyella aurantiaca]|uniref:endonuclease/exonuclease/phosphatase family protein n=1 Tax=Winogradskyella aurantiaca TaxID=2219558 RepID=UPI000E1C8550|nr:endonuclease/exonuclease/phosphatase family protein [Winogradskyella aurantiaca]
MKGLSFLEKIIFTINSLAALLLLLSYGLSFLPPKQFGILSVLSLGVPIFIILNLLFALYWFIKFKKQWLLSVVVLLLGFNYLTSMYQFSGKELPETVTSFTVMSYNVRLFNLFGWIEEEGIAKKIQDFILDESPDILAIQEYHIDEDFDLPDYYKYESLSGNRVKNGQAIFSKFPIINSGAIAFPDTYNDAIYIDVVNQKDTMRIYNIHLQSSKINTSVESLKKESSENLLKRISKTFQAQQQQVEQVIEHMKDSPYRVIISGDFNNTPYSYVYNELLDGFQDTFETAGQGFGRTYDFKFFPFRIDFILADDSVTVNKCRTYKVKYSDHYPIKTTLTLHQ